MFLLISKFNFFASLCWCGVAFSPQWIFHIRLAAQETSGNPLKDSPRKVPPKKLSTILTYVSPICVELFKLFRAWNWRSLWIHLVMLHNLLATYLTPGSWAGLRWPLLFRVCTLDLVGNFRWNWWQAKPTQLCQNFEEGQSLSLGTRCLGARWAQTSSLLFFSKMCMKA